MKKGLVVSVGGSQGAYAGGIIQRLIENGADYDSLYGSSVGSLVIPFAALGDFHHLKIAMTTTTTDDIFSLNPFSIKKQTNGIYQYSINYWNVFKNVFIKKRSTLGDTTKLKTHTIPKFFPEEVYLDIINSRKNLTVMVTNISTGMMEEKKLRDFGHVEFMEWMWASTCAPPFMSIATLKSPDGSLCNYTDGGILSQVPIKQAILDGCDEIDIIILNKEGNNWAIEHIRNLFHYQIKLMMLMMNKIMDHQIDMGYLSYHATSKIRLNFYYTKKRLTNNSLIFDPELMSNWWDQGYEDANSGAAYSYILDGEKNIYYEVKKKK